MKLRIWAGLAACCFSAAGLAPASAAVSSSLEGSFQIRLIDLDPSDGITPWISFVSVSNEASVLIAGHYTTSSTTVPFDAAQVLGTSLAGISISKASHSATAASSIDWDESAAPGAHRFSLSGSLDRLPDSASPAYGLSYLAAGAPFNRPSSFLLSPNTLALFEVDYVAEVTTTVASGQQGLDYEHAQVLLDMKVEGLGSSGTGRQERRNHLNLATPFSLEYHSGRDIVVAPAVSLAESGRVGVAFSNAQNSSLGGDFLLTASVAGRSFLPYSAVPVPEPQSELLLPAGAAGIWLTGWGRRSGRRRARTNAAVFAAILGLWGASSAARAAASSSATADLTVHLIDLNPGDELTPGISSVSGSGDRIFGRVDLEGQSSLGLPTLSHYTSSASAETLSDISLQGRGLYSEVSAALSAGSTLAETHRFSVSGAALRGDDDGRMSTYSAQVSMGQGSSTFVLSPRTAVLFTVDLTLTATTTQASLIKPGDDLYAYEFAEASFKLRVAGYNDGYQEDSITPLELTTRGPHVQRDPVTQETLFPVRDLALVRRATVTFSNLADQPQEVSIDMWLSVFGGNGLAAVPEPAPILCLLAGLGVVAGLRRKGRRRYE